MKYFYGTFMQKQATRNHYVKIIAPNEALARQCMFTHFGEKFMTVYSNAEFEGQAEKFNLTELLNILVTDHGHGSIEYTIL